jgi:hypothetical protein
MTEPSVNRISEECATNPVIEGDVVQDFNRRDSGSPWSTSMSMSVPVVLPRTHQHQIALPKTEKKRVSFMLPLRIDEGNHLSPIQESPATPSHTRQHLTWIAPPLTPAETSTATATGKMSTSSSSSTSTVPGLDFDYSYTSKKKASVAEDAGTQIEMKSLALNEDFETPKEKKGGFSG